MSENSKPADFYKLNASELRFGHEIEIDESGFSFQPILDFELEIDGSVYMYSEGGNLEIFMVGGKLDESYSIAELNNELAAEFMEKVGEYELIEAGIDTLQGYSGFLNEIRFSNGEEEGMGNALICSPYLNQFFFMLVIANAEYWEDQGRRVFNTIKSHIQFQPLLQPERLKKETIKHPDLTVEIHELIAQDEEFLLSIEKGDISLLLAARASDTDEQILITEVIAPDEKSLYQYEPLTGNFQSSLYEKPLIGDHGEVCFFYPRTNQQSLLPGEYRFSFETSSGSPLQQVQIIIRSGSALDRQNIDLNFWFALENSELSDPTTLEGFESDIRQALKQRLAPFKLAPGKIACFQAAPDELVSFVSINLETDLTDCSYMISDSIVNERALNIGLVNQFTQGDPPLPADVDAVSSGSPGMILASASPHACIIIKWPKLEGAHAALADAIIQQLIIFSGIDVRDIQPTEDAGVLTINNEIAWRLRRHPLFYNAD